MADAALPAATSVLRLDLEVPEVTSEPVSPLQAPPAIAPDAR
jgi:hypothetical protein